MPSSLIIVALAAAWLVVLVPMVARKRQQVARTADSAMAARVVRSGSALNEGREEFSMSERVEPSVEDDLAELESELDADLEDEELEPEPRRPASTRAASDRRYRPGRGGFDPEAAEIAARAKYAYRQRVVVALLVLAVATAAVAGFVWSMVWTANGLADVGLIGYLIYLRRQVRIEEEIRQRRLARYNNSRTTSVPEYDTIADEPIEDIEVVSAARREVVERKPSPTSRLRRHAVVVDLDDEDPAFHELDEPGTRPFRRASGE
jgi:Flp pilus assembly protein TadB